MYVLDWLLDSDPAIRWQVLRDLVHAPAEVVAAERARIASEGCGARLLALQGEDGQWAGGACFPAEGWRRTADEGQPWIATLPTLQLLHEFGVDPRDARVQRAIDQVTDNCRWEHAGQPFFSGEVEPCINGRTVALGSYFGQHMDAVVARLTSEQLQDGGWNCEAENFLPALKTGQEKYKANLAGVMLAQNRGRYYDGRLSLSTKMKLTPHCRFA